MAEINKQILLSLNSFTESLRRENTRLDEEERKDRIRQSTSRIAEAFGSLEPGHDEEDARRLMLDVISDTADLDALDANLPLIQSLYSDSLIAIKRFKDNKEDQFLKDYVLERDTNKSIPPGLGGNEQFQLLKYEQSREFRDTIYSDEPGEEGALYGITFGGEGEVINTYLKDSRTHKERDAAAISLAQRKLKTPGTKPLSGMIGANNEPLFLQGDTVVTPVVINGEQVMVPYKGQFDTSLGLRLTKQQSAELRAITDQNIETSRSIKAGLHQTAKELAGQLGISTANDAGDIDAVTAIGEKSYEEIVSKIRTKFEDSPVRQQEVLDNYNLFLDNRKNLRQLNYNIENSLYSQDFNQMLNNSKLTVDEYNSFYPRVIKTIETDSRTGDRVRKKILDLWSKAKGGPAAISQEDPTSSIIDIWNKLNLLDKGIVMAYIKRMKEEE